MKFNELKDRLLRKFTRTEGDAGRRPDGGTSCYRPIRRRNPADPREQEAQQPVSYIHTGFTGMNPPAGGTDPGFSPEASAQMYGQSYSQQAPSYGQQYSQYSQQAPYGQQWQASNPSWGQAPAGQGADLRLGCVEHHADHTDAPVAVGDAHAADDMLAKFMQQGVHPLRRLHIFNQNR